MLDASLPYLTNNEASDDLCGIINQSIQDKASLLLFSFNGDRMKVEYQIAGINYEFAIDKFVKDYEMTSVIKALQSELENWLSEAIIEGTDYRWKKPPDNIDKYTDRVELIMSQIKPIINIELDRIRSLYDTIYIFKFE